jgi:hypothetical protein
MQHHSPQEFLSFGVLLMVVKIRLCGGHEMLSAGNQPVTVMQIIAGLMVIDS